MTTQTPQYLKLKSAEAQKLGRNGGSITYLILTDTDRQQLYVSIVANDSGGFFSSEIAPFEKIEACLPADRTQPFAAKAEGDALHDIYRPLQGRKRHPQVFDL